jgi:hypothetical protein
MNYQEILSQIRDAFVHQDRFSWHKKVVEFFDSENVFQWDIYNFYIREVLPEGSPQYYTITSPYDVTWKWAPQQALVFRDERLIYSTDFAEAVKIRTGCMDPIFLQSLGIEKLSDKRILIVWSGGTARYSYLFLKDSYPDLWTVDYTNRWWRNTEFESLGDLHHVAIPDIGQYDIILLHAHVDTPYLTPEMRTQIKEGAVIISYGGKTPERDISPTFFTSDDTVIVDMYANRENLKPLKSSIDGWSILESEVFDLGKVLSWVQKIDKKTNLTVCISGGTYIQNIAMMKYMMWTQ